MTGTDVRGVWVAICAVLALVAGCAGDPSVIPDRNGTRSVPSTSGGGGPGLSLSILPVGSSEQAISVGGRIRMYRAYRPARLTRFAPLVVMFHGGFGSARLAEWAYGWDALADREGFVVLYPDAVGAAWNVGGGCCGVAPAERVDDVAFVRTAIENLRRRVSLDPSRMYAAGMSSGGMMAYRMACDTTLFAAIGPVAATQLGDCPNPAPTSILHVHGTADPSVPFDGARGGGIAQIEGPAPPALHSAWRGFARCGGDVVSSAGRVVTTTAQCPEGRTVELVAIEGGGHEWPGVARSGPLDASPSPTSAAGSSATSAGASGMSTPPPVVVPSVGPSIASGGSIGTGIPDARDDVALGRSADFVTTAALWTFFKAHGR